MPLLRCEADKDIVTGMIFLRALLDPLYVLEAGPFSDAFLATLAAPGIALGASFALRGGTGVDERIERPGNDATP